MSSLPTPPMEDTLNYHVRRTTKSSKQSKSTHRSSNRSNSSHEHSAAVIDGRHKRVWKACERCRMKKTKCDGESPCKRCKDDGLVCTAGSRKKTEFKQLPRGYAEVLENTQYALIATVQKLYTMVRNNEAWDLGDPEMNDRGQPVIHDIASKLGCIRPSPDLPSAFPEGAEDFAELQAQLQSEMHTDDNGRKLSEGSPSSPALDRTERASSSESDHSVLSKDFNQMPWSQQRQQATRIAPLATNSVLLKPTPMSLAQRQSVFNDETAYQARAAIGTTQGMPSPIYTEFQPELSTFRSNSPFSPWSAGDEFLGQSNQGLDVTAHYMRQYQGMTRSLPLQGSLGGPGVGFDADVLKVMQMNQGMNFAEGTIRPNMLDCNMGFENMDQMDVIFGGEYETHMGMA